MKTLIYILSLYLACSSVLAQDRSSLENYLVLAAENNPVLKAKFNEYLSSLEEVPQVTSLPDPKLAFGIFIQPVETRLGAQKFNVGINQSFPWFGTLKAKSSVAEEMAITKLRAFEEEKSRLYYSVRITYNDLYYLEKSIQINQESLEVLYSLKDLSRINFESGKSGLADLLQIEMEEKELRSKIESIVDLKSVHLMKFQELLNVELTSPISFPDLLWKEELTLDPDMLFDSILVRNPTLQRLNSMASVKDKELQVNEKLSLPSFSIGVNYINVAERTDIDLPDNGQDALILPQVGLSLPIFQKKYKAREKQLKLGQEAIGFRMEAESNQLKTELEIVLNTYKDAHRSLELNEHLYDLGSRSLSLLKTEFTTGTADFDELLDLERKLISYKLKLVRAGVDLNNSVYQLEALNGN